MFTFPVGFGFPGCPDTVTRSCTVVPASTVVTGWCAALWIVVSVVVDNCVNNDCDCPCAFKFVFGTQLLEGSVPSLGTHRSCQVRFAVSVSTCPGRFA